MSTSKRNNEFYIRIRRLFRSKSLCCVFLLYCLSHQPDLLWQKSMIGKTLHNCLQYDYNKNNEPNVVVIHSIDQQTMCSQISTRLLSINSCLFLFFSQNVTDLALYWPGFDNTQFCESIDSYSCKIEAIQQVYLVTYHWPYLQGKQFWAIILRSILSNGRISIRAAFK